MKTAMISFVLQNLLSALPPNVVKRAIDALLDQIEDAVSRSENTVDDAVVTPLVSIVRTSLDIPDDVGGDLD